MEAVLVVTTVAAIVAAFVSIVVTVVSVRQAIKRERVAELGVCDLVNSSQLKDLAAGRAWEVRNGKIVFLEGETS